MLQEILTDTSVLEVIAKLGLALILGGIIGYERQRSQKAAGLRTNILICMGSTLFALIASHFENQDSLARVIGQIVTGIGFLGAGTIMKLGDANTPKSIGGLTTAATIWFNAGVGVCVGIGLYMHAFVATIYAFIVLEFARWKEPLKKFFRISK